jgi:LysR family hydrogen peroxide-inducible transcriptional activator
MTLVPELSVSADDPHVRRFKAPEPVRQVSLVVRRPYVRRRVLEALSKSIRGVVRQTGARRAEVIPPG